MSTPRPSGFPPFPRVLSGLAPVGRFASRSARLVFGCRGGAADLLRLSGLVTLAVLLFVWLYPRSPPYLVIDAVAETLGYRVTRPAMAMVAVASATPRPGTLDGCRHLAGPTVDGVIEPAEGTIVRYQIRPRPDGTTATAVALAGTGAPSGRFRFDDERVCVLGEQAAFVLADGDPGRSTRPLPIAGPGQIGSALQDVAVPAAGTPPAFGLMISGAVNVYGRTGMPFFRGRLYPADAAFVLPAGGMLSAGDDLGPVAAPGIPGWFGFARLEGQAFRVSATTISDDLVLFRPGSESETETFSTGFAAQILSDPSLAFVSLALLILSSAMQAIGTWMSLVRDGRDERDGDGR